MAGWSGAESLSESESVWLIVYLGGDSALLLVLDSLDHLLQLRHNREVLLGFTSRDIRQVSGHVRRHFGHLVLVLQQHLQLGGVEILELLL